MLARHSHGWAALPKVLACCGLDLVTGPADVVLRCVPDLAQTVLRVRALDVMILLVAYLLEAGVMLTWSTLQSRADLDHVAVGTVCLLVGSRSWCLASRTPCMYRR